MASETSLASVMTNPATRDPTVTSRSTIQQLMYALLCLVSLMISLTGEIS